MQFGWLESHSQLHPKTSWKFFHRQFSQKSIVTHLLNMAEVEAGLNCEARTRKPLLQLLREGGFQYSGSFSLSFIMITSAGVRDGGPGGGISVAGKLS